MTETNETVNRAELAREMGVSLPTVDDWVRRGCPVVSKGSKGRSAEFSISDVRTWRAKDVANRCYSREELRILRDSGGEHLNHLRIRVEDSAKHFLWFSFTRGSEIMVEYLKEKRGIPENEAKKLVVAFYLHWSYIYEFWLKDDAYNRALRDHSGEDLDDEFRYLTVGCYKATSFPPSNFDVGKMELPNVLNRYMYETVGPPIPSVA